MGYRIKFKRLEGNKLEKGYTKIAEGLQYQQQTTNVNPNFLLSIGVIISKLSSGHATEMVVPKGKTLEIIFKD